MSGLMSLFGGGDGGDNNDALRYNAPKEPKAKGRKNAEPAPVSVAAAPVPVAAPAPATAADDSAGELPSKIMCSASVRLYKANPSGAYENVEGGNMLGCVIMGSGTAYQILIYNGQKVPQAVIPITSSFAYNVRDLYMSCTDGQGGNWSILYDNLTVVTEALRTLAAVRVYVCNAEISDGYNNESPVASTTFKMALPLAEGASADGEVELATGMVAGITYTAWEVGAVDYPSDILQQSPFSAVLSHADLCKIKLGTGDDEAPVGGLQEVLLGLKKGERCMVGIPPRAAYQGGTLDQSSRAFPAAFLLFEVEVVKVKTSEGKEKKKGKKKEKAEAEVETETEGVASVDLDMGAIYVNPMIAASNPLNAQDPAADVRARMARLSTAGRGGMGMSIPHSAVPGLGHNSSAPAPVAQTQMAQQQMETAGPTPPLTPAAQGGGSGQDNTHTQAQAQQALVMQQRAAEEAQQQQAQAQQAQLFQQQQLAAEERARSQQQAQQQQQNQQYQLTLADPNQQESRSYYADNTSDAGGSNYASPMQAHPPQNQNSYMGSQNNQNNINGQNGLSQQNQPHNQQAMTSLQTTMYQLHSKVDHITFMMNSNGGNKGGANNNNNNSSIAQRRDDRSTVVGNSGKSSGLDFQVDTLVGSLREIAEEYENLKKEKEEAVSNAGSGSDIKIEKLEAKISTLESKVETLQDKNEKLMGEKAEWLEKKADLIQNHQSSSSASLQMQQDATLFKKEASDLKQDKTCLETEISGLKQIKSSLELKVSDLEQALEKANAEISEVSAPVVVEVDNSALDASQNALEKQKQKYEELTQEISKQAEEVSRLTKLIEESDTKQSSFQSEKDEIQGKLEVAEKEKEDAVAASSATGEAVVKSLEEEEKTRKELEACQAKVKELEDTVASGGTSTTASDDDAFAAEVVKQKLQDVFQFVGEKFDEDREYTQKEVVKGMKAILKRMQKS